MPVREALSELQGVGLVVIEPVVNDHRHLITAPAGTTPMPPR